MSQIETLALLPANAANSKTSTDAGGLVFAIAAIVVAVSISGRFVTLLEAHRSLSILLTLGPPNDIRSEQPTVMPWPPTPPTSSFPLPIVKNVPLLP